MSKELTDFSHEELVVSDEGHKLILFNDDINDFDHVIDTLVEVCHHLYEQAEQCALLAHFKGKCAVKSGPLKVLKPMAILLSIKDLTVELQ